MSSQSPGRLPASVYRRRRIVVGLAALAVVAVIVLLISSLVQSRSDARTPGPEASEPPAAEETSAPTDACNPAVIALTPKTDAGEYPDGVQPLVSMEIVNNGAVACTLDVGTDVQLYEIVSGNDPIWNSRDCQVEPAAAQIVIEPNTPITTTPFAWDRTRSSTTTCEGERPQVTAGGATYRLSVSLGEITAESDTAFLLF